MDITIKDFSKIFETNPKAEISTGEKIEFRDYLDRAINDLELKEHDYYSAYYILRKKAEGKDMRKMIIKDFNSFWGNMEEKYGK